MKACPISRWHWRRPACRRGPPVVIQNANVLTVTKGTFRGSVVIRDGKIVEVGEKVMVPPGAQIIDAAGPVRDARHHRLRTRTSPPRASTKAASRSPRWSRIEDVINPEDIAIYRALAGGVTTAHIVARQRQLHRRAAPCHQDALGQGRRGTGVRRRPARPEVRAGREPEALRVGGVPGRTTPRYPATRMGVEDVIRQAFTEAKHYQKAWHDYQAKVKRGEQATPPRRDLKLEPLVEVLEGKRLVHVHCYRADEILMMLRVAEEFGFKIKTLEHVLEGYKVAKEIAAHGAGATTFSDWWAYKMEAFDAIPYNAALMIAQGRAGVAQLRRRAN